jgi:hypothetical protein
MTTEVLEIRTGFSHPSKLAKPSATEISEDQDPDSPVGSIHFSLLVVYYQVLNLKTPKLIL